MCGFRAERVGKPKDWSRNVAPPTGLSEALDAVVGTQMKDALRVLTKGDRRQALMLVDELVMSSLASKVRIKIFPQSRAANSRTHDAQYPESDIKIALKEAQKKAMRQLLREERLRSDGRSPEQIRPIRFVTARRTRMHVSCPHRTLYPCSSEAGLLPRVHGCSMFTRGETQAIAVVTLGGDMDAQRMDGLADTEKFRRFYLNYFFPPSCVGEVRFCEPVHLWASN